MGDWRDLMDEKTLAAVRDELLIGDVTAVVSTHCATGITFIVHAKTHHGTSTADIQACDWCRKLPPDSAFAQELKRLRNRIN